MRDKDFLPQIDRSGSHPFDLDEFRLGAYLVVFGLVKKSVFADSMAPYVDSLFATAGALGSIDSWIAAHLFAFQIYYDFSAYSDIAMGIGLLFGYRLARNFNTPYLSANPAEFWRRWHITLSTWIRDYIYIPLGGSRQGIPCQYLFIMVAMAASGLWHGAGWTFVAWGVYHGFLSIFHRVYQRSVMERIPMRVLNNPLLRVLSVLGFFHLSSLGWVLFRANGMTTALSMIRKMVTLSDLGLAPYQVKLIALLLVLYLLHVGEYWLRTNAQGLYSRWQNRFPAPIRALAYTVVILMLVVFTQTKQTTFIYFQF